MINLDVEYKKDDGYYLLKPMEKLMKQVVERRKINDGISYDDNDILERYNKKIRGNNYYELDINGLVIRRNDKNKRKSLTGYKIIDDKKIHIMVNDMDTLFRNDILEKILVEIKRKITSSRCVLWKIYEELYPKLWVANFLQEI
jgi:hypothetical protein